MEKIDISADTLSILKRRQNINKYNHEFSVSDEDNLRIEYIQKYFKDEHRINIDKDQASILGTNAQNILVTARAGSGKTRTIACRAIYALEKENIKPEEILILAFNKDAAQEIRSRIKNDFGYTKIYDKNVRTFHSLAYSIVLPQENILFNDEESKIRSNYEKFLYTHVLSKILNDDCYEKLYECFHNTDEIVDYEDYKKNRSNRQLYSLNGEKVKSNGEKYIADFLFEHGINYKYEKFLTQRSRKLYKPDFTIYLNNKTYIIEHWGIDENDPNKIVPKTWNKTWNEYKREMNWKRQIISERKEILIETSICNLKKGRKAFENLLKTQLESNGIKCSKLPQEILLEKFSKNMSKQIDKKLINFMQKAKNYQKTPYEIEIELKRQFKSLSLYARDLIKLANETYRLYEEELKRTSNTDFPNLLYEAKKKIENGNYEIDLANGNIQDLSKVKLILIDEFQDFSKPFYGMIKAIQNCNPNVKLFCVGDDWQAINGFAGSSLNFYKEFKKYFGYYVQRQLRLNYRSGSKIVEYGNSIMTKYGQGGKAASNLLKSEKDFIDISRTKYDHPVTEKSDDFKYIFKNQNIKAKDIFYFSIASRYLKECVEKIKELNKENENYTYLILTRESNLDSYVNAETEFKNKLQNVLCNWLKIYSKDEFKNKFKIETIHKSKGAEADIVFLLNFGDKNIKIHPDSEIDLIFGRTQQDIIDEELRLYYVGITRAKQKLYIINEN
ncbi:uncharacterized protein BN776_01982 [Clostridium sp. CAG:768]|nr:uncharacterized protein BN776_01982 [Clostridium sp. CAG:768]